MKYHYDRNSFKHVENLGNHFEFPTLCYFQSIHVIHKVFNFQSIHVISNVFNFQSIHDTFKEYLFNSDHNTEIITPSWCKVEVMLVAFSYTNSEPTTKQSCSKGTVHAGRLCESEKTSSKTFPLQPNQM